MANRGKRPMRRIAILSGDADVRAPVAAGGCHRRGTRRSRSIPWLMLAVISVGAAQGIATAGDQAIARVCAEREWKSIPDVEDHGPMERTASFVGSDVLDRARLMMFEAREECYRGRVTEAVALYDKVVTMLGPASAPPAQ